MSAKDRNILLVVPLIAALIAVWLLVVSPKRDQVKKLDARVTAAQGELATQQQAISQGVGARKEFPRAYHRLVVSGKAVPSHDETASLLVQIDRAASASGVAFQEITGTDTSGDSSSASAAATGTTTPGSSDASLSSTPYTLTFKGTFFEVANFISRMDRLVRTKQDRIPSNGRLTLITGFTLGPDDPKPLPALTASLNIATYSAAPSSATDPTVTAPPSTSTTSSPSTSGTGTNSTASTPTSTAASTTP